MSDNNPNCYACKHRGKIPGNEHSSCKNRSANVVGHPVGIRGGWFYWPLNFDPMWLVSCDGFQAKEEAPAVQR
jgi:hypothetical protein